MALTLVKKFNSFADIPADAIPSYVCVKVDGAFESLGDVTILSENDIMVMNEWSVCLQYFDSRDEALRYIIGRMCEDPIFIRKV